EMQLDVGESAGGLPVWLAGFPEIAEQIRHRGGTEEISGAQRQAAYGAELLFELTGEARVESEMAGIVRAGGELVDEEIAAPGQEEFDAEDADDIELLEHTPGDFNRP